MSQYDDLFSDRNSNSGYKNETKKCWWWDDYDYDYRSHKYSSGSGSRAWMSKISTYSYNYWCKPKDENEAHQELLNQLQNSVNLLTNDDRGQIILRWSNGKARNTMSMETVNKQKQRIIYLSPDNLVEKNSEGVNEVPEKTIDAITGKVYLTATLYDSVSLVAFREAQAARKNAATDSVAGHRLENSIKLWEAIETAIARKKIMENWAGFGPYIAQDAERTISNKEEVQAAIQHKSLDACVTAIAWNILNSSDLIEIPEMYQECVSIVAEAMDKEIKPNARFSTCQKLVNRIDFALNGLQDLNAKPILPKEKNTIDSIILTDSSLLGGIVLNNTDVKLSTMIAADESKVLNDKNSLIEPGCSMLGKEYVVINPLEKRSVESLIKLTEKYKSIVLEHVAAINYIQKILSFRNNINKVVSYGHRTGDLDDNSLFKLNLNDDKIMTRADVASNKRIAVCLLVDESGSMCGLPIAAARNVAITLIEGLKNIDKIDLSVYGHTADHNKEHEQYHGNKVQLFEYFSPRQRNLISCMTMGARSNNCDGWAIYHASNLFLNDYADYERKIMFVISDGQPHSDGYGGTPAKRHVLKVTKACAAKRLEVYGIGVCNAFTHETGEEMYGKNKCVILDDVKSSLGIMARFIKQIAAK